MFPQGLYNTEEWKVWMDEQIDIFDQRANFKLVYLLWPRRCHITDKMLWLTHAYKGTAVWTGPGEPVEEYRYYDEVEFLIRKLKE